MTRICLLVLLLSGCSLFQSTPDTSDLDRAYDDAVEICLAAHQVNVAVYDEPKRGVVKAKIDGVCEPALDALALASSDRASNILKSLRSAIDKVWK